MYRASNYNYTIPYKERIVYLNGISMQVFSLNQKEHQKMQELFKDMISFEINYTSVFEKLKTWGFIVPEDLDEIGVITYRHRKDVFRDNDYLLVINPTLECNFRCWYCYEEHPQGHMDAAVISKLEKHITYMVEKQKIHSLHLSWFGGEPLLYFDEVIYPLSRFAQEICRKNGIPFRNSATTNASRITPGMIGRMQEVSLSFFQITIDGDQKRHDSIRHENGKPSFDTIIGNISSLCRSLPDVQITLRINYDDQTLKQCDLGNVLKLFPEDHRKKISVDLQRVWQTVRANTADNSERINLHKQCSELGYRPGNAGQNYFAMGKFHRCYADRFCHTEINYDGRVYRCTARGYAEQYVVGKLGENGLIRWNEREMARRFSKAPFENEMCLKCAYLPLCLGPCSQKIAENSSGNLDGLCYLNFMEVRPENIITDYYEEKIKALSTTKE